MLIFLLLFVFIICLIGSFYFSGTEAGFLALKKERFNSDKKKIGTGAYRISWLVENLDQVLSTTLIGNNLVNNTAYYLGIFFCIFVLGESHVSFLLISTALSLVIPFILFVFGEVLPKIIFKTYPNLLLYKYGLAISFFHILFRPLIVILNRVSTFLLLPALYIFKNDIKFNRKDLASVLSDGYSEGVLDKDDRFFYETVSSLSQIKVVEVMHPLADLLMINHTQNIFDDISTVRKNRLDIVPVYKDRIDNIIGYIEIIEVLNSSKKIKTADYIRDVHYIPETVTIDEVYLYFQKNMEALIVVVDEYGGCSGIITEWDIIERIFGFKYNVQNRKRDRMISSLEPNKYEVDTLFDIDDLNSRLGINVPKNGYETLGGFINSLFGKIPETGETRTWKNITFTVLTARKTAVDKVEIVIENPKKT